VRSNGKNEGKKAEMQQQVGEMVEEINRLGEIFGGYSPWVTVSYGGTPTVVVCGNEVFEGSLAQVHTFIFGVVLPGMTPQKNCLKR
jgi:hypothetical protein